MDLALCDYRADRVDRGHYAIVQVLAHAEVTVCLVGVLPGHDEHRLALADQVADQRVPRRQVEDVVLHDPGRHDQDRLRDDLLGLRLVLDQLEQPVLVHHLPGRNGDVLAHDEFLEALRQFAAALAPHVLGQVVHAALQVRAALLFRRADELRIGHRQVRRGRHLDDLAGQEADQLFVVLADPVNAGRGFLGQFLGEPMAVCENVERPFLPVLGEHAAVGYLRQVFAIGSHRLAVDLRQFYAVARHAFGQRQQFSRRQDQVPCPVDDGRGHVDGRHAAGGGGHLAAQLMIDFARLLGRQQSFLLVFVSHRLSSLWFPEMPFALPARLPCFASQRPS